MPNDHAALYGKLRASFLTRHFAVNQRFRTNHFFHSNVLGHFAGPARLWGADHVGGNPLMLGGQFLALLAIEHALGQPDAIKIIRQALQSIAVLHKFDGDFAGYISRWDAVTSADSSWNSDDRTGTYSRSFWLDQDRRYMYCVPFDDPRYVRLRPMGEVAGMAESSRTAYWNERVDFIHQYRFGEVSQDELIGLLAGYDMVYRLVPDANIRSDIRQLVSNLAQYLSVHGYLLVRPCGGFTAQGGSGLLPAFEFPFQRVFRRITGTDFPATTDFQGAMEKAGLWGCVSPAVARWSVAGVLLDPIIQPLLATIALSLPLFNPINRLNGPQLGTVYAIYEQHECFDVYTGPFTDDMNVTHTDQTVNGHQTDFALACLLMNLDPITRFTEWAAALASPLVKTAAATNFFPYFGLMALDESDQTVGGLYRNWIASKQSGNLSGAPLVPDLPAPDRCFASAVALLVGDESQPAKLMARLDGYFRDFGGPVGDLRVDGSTEEYTPALDYMTGVALAWLAQKRQTDRGQPALPGLPGLPNFQSWPKPIVPADIVKAGMSGALPVPIAALRRNPPVQPEDVDVFEDPPARLPDPPPVVPLGGTLSLIFDQTAYVPESSAGVATGAFLSFGDEFEIIATGEITPGFLMASNGPNGTSEIAFDLKFPFHGTPSAHPFALIGWLDDNGGYFSVGAHRSRQAYLGSQVRQLHLRTNDDTPGGGSGQFVCQVRVWGHPSPTAIAAEAVMSYLAPLLLNN